jgi:hypothetical protein
MFEYKKFPDPGTKQMQHWPYDPETERHYRKIVGGFVSPGPGEGAVVVCGLEYSWRPPAAIYLLDEFQSSQPESLILRAVDSRENFKCEEFFSYNDQNFLRYLATRNAAQREKQGAGLYPNQAPNADTDNISYHLHLLINLLSSGGKRLVLGNSSNIHAALQAVPQSEINTASCRQHPLVAALGYAVSALEVYCADYRYQGNRPKARTDYDIANYMP